MKIKDLKLNEHFLTDSGTEFQLLATPEMLSREEKWHYKNLFKCVDIDTGEIFYLIDNMLIRKTNNHETNFNVPQQPGEQHPGKDD